MKGSQGILAEETLSVPFRLCDLSNELISLVASQCDPVTLSALSQTCHLIKDLAVPVLYRHIVIKDEKALELLYDLTRRPEIGTTRRHFWETKSFDVSVPWCMPTDLKWCRIDCVSQMIRLQNLAITYDYSEEEDWLPYYFMWLPRMISSTLVTCGSAIT